MIGGGYFSKVNNPSTLTNSSTDRASLRIQVVGLAFLSGRLLRIQVHIVRVYNRTNKPLNPVPNWSSNRSPTLLTTSKLFINGSAPKLSQLYSMIRTATKSSNPYPSHSSRFVLCIVLISGPTVLRLGFVSLFQASVFCIHRSLRQYLRRFRS